MDFAGDSGSETGTVFAEAKIAFADSNLNRGRWETTDQSAEISAEEVKIRIPVSEKVLEIVCPPEKTVLKTVLEAVVECF